MAKKAKGKGKQEEKAESNDVNSNPLPMGASMPVGTDSNHLPVHTEPQASTWGAPTDQGWGSNVDTPGESWGAGTQEPEDKWEHGSLLEPPLANAHSFLPTIPEQPSSGHFTQNRTALSDVGESPDEYSDSRSWTNQHDPQSPQPWDGPQSQTLTATAAPSIMGTPSPPQPISITEAVATAQKDMQKQQKISSASEAARRLEESRALQNDYSKATPSIVVSPAVHYEALNVHPHATPGHKPISTASAQAKAFESSTTRNRIQNATNNAPPSNQSHSPLPGKRAWNYPQPLHPSLKPPAAIPPDPSWTMTGGNAWSNKHRTSQSASVPNRVQGNENAWNQQLHQYRQAEQAHQRHPEANQRHPAQQRPRHSKHHSHTGHPTHPTHHQRPQTQQNASWQGWGKEGWDQAGGDSGSEAETVNGWTGTQHGGDEWGQSAAAWGQHSANPGKSEGKRERGRGRGRGKKPEDEWGQTESWGQAAQGGAGGQGWDQGNNGWGNQQNGQTTEAWGQPNHQEDTWGQGGETWGQEESGWGNGGENARGKGGENAWGNGGDLGRGKSAESAWGNGGDPGRGKGAENAWGNGGDTGRGKGAESAWGNGGETGRGKGAENAWGNGGETAWGKGSEGAWGNVAGEWGGGAAPSNSEWGTNPHQPKVTFAAAEAAGSRNVLSSQQRSQILNSLLNQPQNQKPLTGHAAQQVPAAAAQKGQQKANDKHNTWGAWEAQDNGWGSMDEDEDNDGEYDENNNRRVHFSPKASDIWGGSPRAVPSKTLAHAQQGIQTALINDATNVRFVESRGAAFDFVSEAFFGNARLARERVHWLFPSNKDERVANMLAWVQKMSFNLGTYGLMKFLEHRERGALFVNTVFRMQQHPREPAFDYLTFNHLQGTMDKGLQESVAFYDPAKLVIVFVYLPSETGKSVAIWRRKVNVPDNARLKYQAEVNAIVKTLRKDKEYVVMVDELPPKPKTLPQKPGQLRKSVQAKATARLPNGKEAVKKKRKWWKLFLS